QNGMLDVNGNVYADEFHGDALYQGVNPVVDFGDAATTSLPGISELATDAETIAGTDTDRVVTPHGLAAAIPAARDAGVFDTRYYTEAETDSMLAVGTKGRIPSSVAVGSGSASVAADGVVMFTGCSTVSLNGVFDGLGMDIYDIYVILTGSVS